MRFPHKIPTLLGLLLVLIIVGAVVFFTEGAFLSPSRASESEHPTEATFTNVTDTTFTISWLTAAGTTGTALVTSTGKSGRVYYDERDAAGKLGKYTAHSIPIRDAQPDTQYSIKLLSNGHQYIDQNKPYELHTPAKISPNINTLEPAYGTILTTSGTPAEGALVYLTFDGGQQLSSLTKSSGLWLIPLNQVRTEDLSGFLSASERTRETIRVRYGDGSISASSDPLNDSPVPDMTVGQTYDFRGQQVNKTSGKALALQATPTALPLVSPTTAPVGGAVLGQTATPGVFKVTLASPAEGASLPTMLPLISGTGIPNKFVGVSIGITSAQSGSAKVKADGTWNFTPAKNLAPGKQSVTITTIDEKGKTVAITHSFQILKSGTQVLGDATPSATLTLTITPTLSASGSASPTPTEIITETPESTLSGQEVPVTGNQLPTILLLIFGVALLATGMVAVKL